MIIYDPTQFIFDETAANLPLRFSERQCRDWAIAVLCSVPCGEITERDRMVLERYGDRIEDALRRKPMDFKGHER